MRELIESALEKPLSRTIRLRAPEGVYWLKQKEPFNFFRCLQKGNPERAFERERIAYHVLGNIGLPIPPLAGEGENWFVVPDTGPTLSQMLWDGEGTQDERITAFKAAGSALAQWHTAGFSHGRPAIRDICWDGERTTFIDLENYRNRFNKRSGHARDLIIFVHSGLTIGGGPNAETDHAIQSYRDADQKGVWQEARRLCKRLRIVNFLTRKIQQRPDGKSKEIKAIPHTLKAFGVL